MADADTTAVLAAAVSHLTAEVAELRQQDDLTPEQVNQVCAQLLPLTNALADAMEPLASGILRFYDHGFTLRDDEGTDLAVHLAITVGGLYKARLSLSEATSAMQSYHSEISRADADARCSQSVAEPSFEAPAGCRCPILPNTSRLLVQRSTVLIAPDCPLHNPDRPTLSKHRATERVSPESDRRDLS